MTCKSHETLHMHQKCWTLLYFKGFAHGRVNGSIAPPIGYLKWSPSYRFHLHARNLVDTCNIPRLRKTAWPKCNNNFEFYVTFVCIYGHLQGSYFDKHRPWRLIRMTSNLASLILSVKSYLAPAQQRLETNFTSFITLPAWTHLKAKIDSVIAPPTGNRTLQALYFYWLLLAG